VTVKKINEYICSDKAELPGIDQIISHAGWFTLRARTPERQWNWDGKWVVADTTNVISGYP
jgi:hypothetical protein